MQVHKYKCTNTNTQIQAILLLKSQYDLSREVLEAEKRSSTVEMKLAKITNEVEKLML